MPPFLYDEISASIKHCLDRAENSVTVIEISLVTVGRWPVCDRRYNHLGTTVNCIICFNGKDDDYTSLEQQYLIY